MKPVELSQFDINRIIYEETRSVVNELSQLDEAIVLNEWSPLAVPLWILGKLSNIVITPAYAPMDQEEVEKLEKERWSMVKSDIEVVLMVVGMLPGYGDAVDLTMAIYYALRGELLDAGFSLLSAAPGLGSFIAAVRLAKRMGDMSLVYDIVKAYGKQPGRGINIKPLKLFQDEALEISNDARRFIQDRLDPWLSDPKKLQKMYDKAFEGGIGVKADDKFRKVRGAPPRVPTKDPKKQRQFIEREVEDLAVRWKNHGLRTLSLVVPVTLLIVYAFSRLLDYVSGDKDLGTAILTEVFSGLEDGVAVLVGGGSEEEAKRVVDDRLEKAANQPQKTKDKRLNPLVQKFQQSLINNNALPSQPGFEKVVKLNLGDVEVPKDYEAQMPLYKKLLRLYLKEPDSFKFKESE